MGMAAEYHTHDIVESISYSIRANGLVYQRFPSLDQIDNDYAKYCWLNSTTNEKLFTKVDETAVKANTQLYDVEENLQEFKVSAVLTTNGNHIIGLAAELETLADASHTHQMISQIYVNQPENVNAHTMNFTSHLNDAVDPTILNVSGQNMTISYTSPETNNINWISNSNTKDRKDLIQISTSAISHIDSSVGMLIFKENHYA